MAEQLRQPTNTRRLPNNSVRHPTRPRWVAYYEGVPGGKPDEKRRRVGLLVPRHTQQDPHGASQIAYGYDGELAEFRIGYSDYSHHGEWYVAHANELPREQWQAIRCFWTTLSSQ